MAGLGHEVIERFELARLLHWQKFEPEAISDQAAKTENRVHPARLLFLVGWTSAVHVNNYFQLVCLVKWAGSLNSGCDMKQKFET